jgi:hypothetical protein
MRVRRAGRFVASLTVTATLAACAGGDASSAEPSAVPSALTFRPGSGSIRPDPDLGHDLVLPVVWGVLVAAAPVAGLVYLVVGGIQAARRSLGPPGG